jgi:monoamine oxidase
MMPPPPPPPGTPAKVVIVGGGLAGLHCAYRLGLKSVRAEVYEASSTFGGRMQTDRTTFPGMHCELGGELIDSNHTVLRGLATELGVELLDYETDTASLAKVVAYVGGRSLTEADLIQLFRPVALKIDAAFDALTDPYAPVSYRAPNGGQALDALSLKAWLDREQVTGDIRTVLETAYVTEYGLDAEDSNVLNLLMLIGTDTSSGLQLYGESDERYHAKDGNGTFIDKLVAGLPGDALHVGAKLVDLGVRSDGVHTLTFEEGGSTRAVTAEHVVLALPFSTLRDVRVNVELPMVKRLAITELGYGQNVKLMCGFSSRPWRAPPHFSNGEVLADLPLQATWETSRLQPGAAWARTARCTRTSRFNRRGRPAACSRARRASSPRTPAAARRWRRRWARARRSATRFSWTSTACSPECRPPPTGAWCARAGRRTRS